MNFTRRVPFAPQKVNKIERKNALENISLVTNKNTITWCAEYHGNVFEGPSQAIVLGLVEQYKFENQINSASELYIYQKGQPQDTPLRGAY